MGSLGFSEMLVIFIVALLVFGPKKLPELGKSLGKGIREFKKATDELKSSWEDQVKDISAPLHEMKRDINNMGQNLQSDFYKSIEGETATGQTAQATPEKHETPQQPDDTVPKEHV